MGRDPRDTSERRFTGFVPAAVPATFAAAVQQQQELTLERAPPVVTPSPV